MDELIVKEYIVYRDNGKLGFVIEKPNDTELTHTTSQDKIGRFILRHALKNTHVDSFTITIKYIKKSP